MVVFPFQVTNIARRCLKDQGEWSPQTFLVYNFSFLQPQRQQNDRHAFKWVFNTNCGFKEATWTLEHRNRTSSRLNLAFSMIGKATADEITATLVGKKITFTVLSALLCCKNELRDKWSVVYSDNHKTICVLTKGTSRDPQVMQWLRSIFWVSATYNFRITVRFVPSNANLVADAIWHLHDPALNHVLSDQALTIAANFHNQCFLLSHHRCSPCSRTATSRRIETVPFPCFCTMYNSRIQVTIRSAPSPLPLLWLHTGSLPLYTPPSTHSFPRSNSVTYHYP